ncbi:MAG TPA: NAD-binding protein, partial [Bacteroidales bacterium]|nr:NAD-binding protein [Bacteroidales bacterium]
MKIIIAGDGEVGFHLAKLLSNDRHSITVVDPCHELIKMIESNTDLFAITGDSTSISVLNQAGVANTDLLMAVV